MNKTSQKKGFTIIETLVAVFILVLGIAGPMTVVFNSIQSASISQDKVAAYYFAQEGVEFIRYVRDTNIIVGDGWLDNLLLCTNGSPCNIDDPLTKVSDPGNVVRNCGGGCNPIAFDGDRYGEAGTDTRFTREIVVDDSVALQAEIIVTVTWDNRGNSYSFELREFMFDWSGGS